MERMIAFCGVSCSHCPAYVATQANEPSALEDVLVEWRAYFDAPHLTVRDILCDGCQTQGGRLNGYCQHCKMRPCALGRDVPTCAHCDEYPCPDLQRMLTLCDDLEGFFAYARPARATLEGIRARLSLANE